MASPYRLQKKSMKQQANMLSLSVLSPTTAGASTSHPQHNLSAQSPQTPEMTEEERERSERREHAEEVAKQTYDLCVGLNGVAEELYELRAAVTTQLFALDELLGVLKSCFNPAEKGFDRNILPIPRHFLRTEHYSIVRNALENVVRERRDFGEILRGYDDSVSLQLLFRRLWL